MAVGGGGGVVMVVVLTTICFTMLRYSAEGLFQSSLTDEMFI